MVSIANAQLTRRHSGVASWIRRGGAGNRAGGRGRGQGGRTMGGGGGGGARDRGRGKGEGGADYDWEGGGEGEGGMSGCARPDTGRGMAPPSHSCIGGSRSIQPGAD